MDADRYYVSVIFDAKNKILPIKKICGGIGIDLGIKDTAIISDGRVFKNINKTSKIKKIERN